MLRLQEEVNLVRRERVIFDNVFEKLEMDLKNKEDELKKYLLETIIIENERTQILEDLTNIRNSANQQKDNYLNRKFLLKFNVEFCEMLHIGVLKYFSFYKPSFINARTRFKFKSIKRSSSRMRGNRVDRTPRAT